MKKNDVFTFTAPNGVGVTAVVISLISYESAKYNPQIKVATYLAYAQNRIFRCWTENRFNEDDEASFVVYNPENYIIVDYAILPDYDELLQLHSSMEYPLWEQNLETEIQGMNDR